MQIKTAIKAVAVTAAGALMLGATLAGTAMAADLGTFPAPFVEDGAFNAKLVLGSGGTSREGLAQDLSGALQVAAALGQATINEVDAEGVGSVQLLISGVRGKSAEVAIGEAVTLATNLGATLCSVDLPMLFDGKVYDDEGDEYDAREEVLLNAAIKPLFEDDEDVRDLVLEVPNGRLEYMLSINDDLPVLSSSNKLYLTMLGQDYTVIEYDNTSSALMFERGTSKLLMVGDSTTYGDYTISLDNVDTSASTARISVSVSGAGCSEAKIISQSSSTDQPKKNFCSSNVQVQLMSAIAGAAELSIGEKVTTTVENNDDEWFGDEDYTVAITAHAASTGNGPGRFDLELKYSPDTSLMGEDALVVGEGITFLHDAFELKFDGLTAEHFEDVDISIGSGKVCTNAGDDTESTNEKVVKIEFGDDIDMRVLGETQDGRDVITNATSASMTRANELYLGYHDAGNLSVVVKTTSASGSDTRCVGLYNLNGSISNVTVLSAGKYGETSLRVLAMGTGTAWDEHVYFEFSMFEDQFLGNEHVINVTTANDGSEFTHLIKDTATEEATATDLNLFDTDANYNRNKGAEEKDYITNYGVRIEASESDLEDGVLQLDVPKTQDKAEIFIGTANPTTKDLDVGESYEGITVNAINVEGATMASVTAISVPVAALDSEVTDKTATNMILFGGMVVNTLVEELAADLNLTAADFGSAASPLGKLILVEEAFGGDNVALIVAGLEAANTQAACWVLANYGEYVDELEGKTDVSISGTGTINLNVE